jgi:hypothetical protein
MKVIALASEFYAAADSFVNLMPKLILQTATLPSLLAQYTARVSADGPKE